MITVAYSLFYVSDQSEQHISLILNFAVSYEEWIFRSRLGSYEMLAIKIYLIGFCALHLFCYLSARKERQRLKTTTDPTLEEIERIYPIVKIRNNLYYFRGSYLTNEYFYFNNQKLKHYKRKNYILNLLRIVKNT